jgi:hypothetical protein
MQPYTVSACAQANMVVTEVSSRWPSALVIHRWKNSSYQWRNVQDTQWAIHLYGYAVGAAAGLLTHITTYKMEWEINIHKGGNSSVHLIDRSPVQQARDCSTNRWTASRRQICLQVRERTPDFQNAFFAIFHISLALTFIYCRFKICYRIYKLLVAKLIIIQIDLITE